MAEVEEWLQLNVYTPLRLHGTLKGEHYLEIWALLGRYAALSGNPLPTLRDNVSFPSSKAK
jgi:hypothetical protein